MHRIEDQLFSNVSRKSRHHRAKSKVSRDEVCWAARRVKVKMAASNTTNAVAVEVDRVA